MRPAPCAVLVIDPGKISPGQDAYWGGVDDPLVFGAWPFGGVLLFGVLIEPDKSGVEPVDGVMLPPDIEPPAELEPPDGGVLVSPLVEPLMPPPLLMPPPEAPLLIPPVSPDVPAPMAPLEVEPLIAPRR